MIDWLRRGSRHFTRAFSPDGILIANNPAALSYTTPELRSPLPAEQVEGFLYQLEDEGYALRTTDGYSISWDAMYDLLQHRDHGPSVALLRVPPVRVYSPVLESRDSLTDCTFSISIAGWRDESGRRADSMQLSGPIVRRGEEVNLLPQPVWQVVRRVSAFCIRDQNHRTADAHRRAWSEIRRLAVAAKAQLDTFLFQTVVLTPERLEIRLAKTEIGGSKVIEVIPGFADEPGRWLHTFDALKQVPDRYDIPTPDGIVQVLIIPEVKTVLEQIKRMPGRRVAGSRAEAFVTNPFAALGEDASRAIDADQFERARAKAGLLFERFIAHVKRDGLGYPVEIGLLIEQTDPAGPASSELRLFTNDEELLAFVRLARERLSEGMQLCAWEGYDFELLGDTHREVEVLEKACADRRKPHTLMSYADIYDLTRYADRVEIIGVEKPYYSPFIAKKDNDDGWFPENIVPMIAWAPEDGGEPIAVPLTDELKGQIEVKIAEAKAAGRVEINLSGFEKPLPVKEAEFILETFRKAVEDSKNGEFDPSGTGLKKNDLRHRPGLVIHANIKTIDYEEARRDILAA
jgi:hypothetical protein